MPLETITIDYPAAVEPSVRVAQLAGLFDLRPDEHAARHITAQIPAADDPWKIGLIVGPSGTGKSSIARAAYSAELYAEHEQNWSPTASLLDHFPTEISIKTIASVLTAVGFSSPPSWLRSHHQISTGERFRVSLAHALLTGGKRVVFDEFTSVVDRTVAKVGSAALAKAVHGGTTPCEQFVAVTCHYDVAEWLEPDWILDTASMKLARGSLRRPRFAVELRRAEPRAWRLFANHHYMTATLHKAARCYIATWEDRPVAFVATLAQYGHKGRRRITRLVTLPDFQGIGIGGRVLAAVAREEASSCHSLRITSSHPAIIEHCRRAPWWRCCDYRGSGYGNLKKKTHSTGRPVATFQYQKQLDPAYP